MIPYVRAYLSGDAAELAPRLRQADLQEIHASTALPPQEVLTLAAEESQPSCTVIGESGHVAALFGAVPSAEGCGVVWLLGSDELTKGKTGRAFLKHAPAYLRTLHHLYPLLYNYIDERNTVHIHWLKRFGFTFISRHPQHGHLQLPFLEFARIQPYV